VSVSAVREPVRLTPLQRLEALCDPGSVQTLRSRVVSSKLGARARSGDGVVGATGMVNGRPIACYAQDGSYLGGSLGERHADTVVRVLELAGRSSVPVVAFVESGGALLTLTEAQAHEVGMEPCGVCLRPNDENRSS